MASQRSQSREASLGKKDSRADRENSMTRDSTEHRHYRHSKRQHGRNADRESTQHNSSKHLSHKTKRYTKTGSTEHSHASGDEDGHVVSKPLIMPQDSIQLLSLLSTCVRLPVESLCNALLYIHRYNKFIEEQTTKNEPNGLIDDYSLVVCALSIASKTTEASRRLRELLVPAYHLVHGESASRLKFPTDRYDSIRAGVVFFETILFRILDYDVSCYTPFSLTSDGMLLDIVLRNAVISDVYGTADLTSMVMIRSKDKLALQDRKAAIAKRCGIVQAIDTLIGVRSIDWTVKCYQKLEIALNFSGNVIAVASVFMAAIDCGYKIIVDSTEFIQRVASSNENILNGIDVRSFVESTNVAIEKLKRYHNLK
ncbi:hypothetical protein V1511DRAFT_494205 [Dipodascopsis uninucleata]